MGDECFFLGPWGEGCGSSFYGMSGVGNVRFSRSPPPFNWREKYGKACIPHWVISFLLFGKGSVGEFYFLGLRGFGDVKGAMESRQVTLSSLSSVAIWYGTVLGMYCDCFLLGKRREKRGCGQGGGGDSQGYFCLVLWCDAPESLLGVEWEVSRCGAAVLERRFYGV